MASRGDLKPLKTKREKVETFIINIGKELRWTARGLSKINLKDIIIVIIVVVIVAIANNNTKKSMIHCEHL